MAECRSLTIWRIEWMNRIAPFAHTLFIRNHGRLMQQGAEGLARMLGAPLLSQEIIDLKAGITHVSQTW